MSPAPKTPGRARKLALLFVPALGIALAAAFTYSSPDGTRVARAQAEVPAVETTAPASSESAAPLAEGDAAVGPSPVGEIAFDHTIHAGKYAIPCVDCHAFADKTPSAGIPSGRKCMGCHKFVAKDSPAIQTLAARFGAGESLRWERVFYLPDYIYFSHRMHVRADVACSECHGDVASMKKVEQKQPFTMGRCLSCHEQRNATRECLGCHK